MTLISGGKQTLTSYNAENSNTIENNEHEEEYEDENEDFHDGKLINNK